MVHIIHNRASCTDHPRRAILPTPAYSPHPRVNSCGQGIHDGRDRVGGSTQDGYQDSKEHEVQHAP